MSNQLQITGAAKVRGLEGVLTGTSGIVGALGINVANGIPKLDSNGKILVSQLPSSVMEYKGTWNAATNTPTLANGTGDTGDVYLCNVAGTTNFGAGPITFAVGDQVIYSGSIWQKASGATGTVTSVAMTVPSGLTVTGSPITTAGTLAVSLSSGYTIPTTSFLAGLVPYSGATGNVNLGEYGLSGGYLGLDTTPTSTPTSVGTLSWDTTYLTPKVVTGTGSTTLQIGQEEVILVHNNTGSTLVDGQVVYVTGSTGELPSVSLADASSETTSAATLGVVTETIANGANGFITVSGIVHGLNTLAYNEGDLLWLSETAGEFTNVKPISPAHLVLIGYVIKRAGGNGTILVKIQNTQELAECSDVLFTSLANNDILQYKSATGLWVNSPGTTTSIAEGTNLYYTDSRARAALSATTPLSYNSTTGAFSIQQASNFQSGFLSSTDWNTFNGKQAALNGIGFVKISGTTISYDNTAYLPLTGGTLYGTLNTTSEIISLSSIVLNETGTLTNYSGNTNFTGAVNGLRFKLGGGLNASLLFDVFGLKVKNNFGYTAYFAHVTSADLTYNLPSSAGTLALTSDIPSLSGYVPYTGATGAVTLGANAITANNYILNGTTGNTGLYYNSTDNRVTLANYNTGGSLVFEVNGGTYAGRFFSSGNLLIGTSTTDSGFKLDVSGTARVSGNLSVQATGTGYGLTVNGLANYYSAYIQGSTTTGQSAGLLIQAGTNSSDSALIVANATATQLFKIRGDGAATFATNVLAANYYAGSLNSTRIYLDSDTVQGVFSAETTPRFILGRDAFSSGQAGLVLGGGSTWAGIGVPNNAGGNGVALIFSTGSGTTTGLAAVERMRLTATGLGIGTSSPSTKLHIVSGQSTIPDLFVQGAGTLQGWLGFGNNADYSIQGGGDYSAMIFRTNATERMRITSSGNVGIGTTTDAFVPNIFITGGVAKSVIRRDSTSTTLNTEAPTLMLYNGGSLTQNQIAKIAFSSNSGSAGSSTNGIIGADISAVFTGNNTGNGRSTDLVFSTNNQSVAQETTERMRITSGGSVVIGSSSVVGANPLLEVRNSSGREGISIISDNGYSPIAIRNAAASNNYMFYVNQSNVGYLNASAWSYGSDIRLKENISYIEESGLQKILLLKPAKFDYINGAKNNIGWIAQDVQEIIPEAIAVSDEQTGMLSLKSDFIVPYLVKAIQELKAEIDELKNK